MAETRRTPNQLPAGQEGQVPVIRPPRLPYHPEIETRLGVTKGTWKVLTDVIYPNAQCVDTVIMVITYCQARGFDILKRCVHIVPVWNSKLGREVETIWPGIGEIRITAHRSKSYAGKDKTAFGPDKEGSWTGHKKNGDEFPVDITFPEWAQVTVYRLVKGEKCSFAGPIVYWLEDVSTMKGNVPNSMWQKRPRGQLEKVAEAAALRLAFPEEVGNDYIDAEAHISEPEHDQPATFSETVEENAKQIEGQMGSKTVEVEEPTTASEPDTPKPGPPLTCTNCKATSTDLPTFPPKDGKFQCGKCLKWTLEPDGETPDQADGESFLEDD